MTTRLTDKQMAECINSTMQLVYSTELGECWYWGKETYCVVHDNFTKWFSTNSLNIANDTLNNKHIEHNPPIQLTLFQ